MQVAKNLIGWYLRIQVRNLITLYFSITSISNKKWTEEAAYYVFSDTKKYKIKEAQCHLINLEKFKRQQSLWHFYQTTKSTKHEEPSRKTWFGFNSSRIYSTEISHKFVHQPRRTEAANHRSCNKTPASAELDLGDGGKASSPPPAHFFSRKLHSFFSQWQNSGVGECLCWVIGMSEFCTKHLRWVGKTPRDTPTSFKSGAVSPADHRTATWRTEAHSLTSMGQQISELSWRAQRISRINLKPQSRPFVAA